MRLIKRINNKIYWIAEDIKFNLLLKKKSQVAAQIINDYSIGVTTFLDRYDEYFKSLIKKLVRLFPDKKIIVAVNGHIKKREHINYLNEITNYIKDFNNVLLIKFVEPQGLSKLWNEIIRHSNSSLILMLNDDIKLGSDFRNELQKNDVIETDIAVINGSWGHFLISKKIIEQVGWFDENLLEIGGEDDDYCARLAINKIEITHKTIKSITNTSKPLKMNSYGKDMTGDHRYSAYNTEYLLKKKWIASNEPFDGAVYVPNRAFKYWKLRNI